MHPNAVTALRWAAAIASGAGKKQLSNFGLCIFLIRRKNMSETPFCLRNLNDISIFKKMQNEVISLPLEQNSEAQEEERFKMC